MTLRTRFETLVIFDPNRSPATANAWISHPSPTEELALGKLIILSRLPGNDRLNLDIITLMQEELRSAYYQSTDAKPERAFEHAIQQLNRRLHQVISDGVAHWVDESDVLIVALWRDQLMMSLVGQMHAFLLRRGRMHDIIGPSDRSPVNPVRLFSQVVSGQLQADDQVLLCTPSLLDYFSMEKLRRTMLDGRPSSTIHQWETTLLGVEQRNVFTAVIIQTQAPDAVVTPASRPVPQSTLRQSAPQASMEHLIAKEQATERLLSPSMWPAVRDAGQQIGQALRNTTRRLLLHKPPRRSLTYRLAPVTTTPDSIGPSRFAVFRRVLAGTAGWINVTWRALFSRQRGIPSASTPVSMPAAPRRPWRLSLNAIVAWLQRLNRRQQVFLGATIVAVVVLAISVYPRTSSTPASTTADPVAAIQDQLSQARAALLYGGEATAQEHINSAQKLLASLPAKTKKEKTAKQELTQALTDVLTQVAHRTVISNPATVTDVATVAPGIQPRQLYRVGQQLVTIDPDGQRLVRVSPGSSQAPQSISVTTDIGRPLTGAVTGTGTVIFATDQLGFIELDAARSTWKELNATWPVSGPRIQSIATYQSRVYVLDPAHNAIIRFSRGGSSLGTGTLWLKNEADLGAARDLSVDGSIYILQPNGRVELYANGRRSDFTLPTMTPNLHNPTRLWTDLNATALYLVDPAERRIVVVSKSGTLLDQYTSDAWGDLRDVAIDLPSKTAYVLSGTTITSFTLLH